MNTKPQPRNVYPLKKNILLIEDVILLDNRLPDGFDLISYIKANCPGTKVIMMSGVDKSAADFALETCADAFLPKPFKKAALMASTPSAHPATDDRCDRKCVHSFRTRTMGNLSQEKGASEQITNGIFI